MICRRDGGNQDSDYGETLDSLSYVRLKELSKEAGLPANKKKAELIAALEALQEEK